MTTISFRPYLPRDAAPLADLYAASIEELTVEDYDEGQRAAWASAADDVEAFGARLAGWLTILAEAEGEILGFAALRDDPKVKENRIIEMLYVSPDHAGQGIGKALVDVMELLARQRGAETATVDASETAREFFAARGYAMQARNTVMRGDEWLVNTTMKKTLPEKANANG
ncbi:MAG: GNAT family N-acetyltransferase [Beijerinckiaceae bacterium]|nr:GNAT family N-acetyltransferase [Beijerinckiaceae bacterium]MCZ8301605.1 GNAT family N-acetyltransferase [Beijerinckiaceae bacterium]